MILTFVQNGRYTANTMEMIQRKKTEGENGKVGTLLLSIKENWKRISETARNGETAFRL